MMMIDRQQTKKEEREKEKKDIIRREEEAQTMIHFRLQILYLNTSYHIVGMTVPDAVLSCSLANTWNTVKKELCSK